MEIKQKRELCSNEETSFFKMDIPKQYCISLKVNGVKRKYDVRYLYQSILKTLKDPITGYPFTLYQKNKIIRQYQRCNVDFQQFFHIP